MANIERNPTTCNKSSRYCDRNYDLNITTNRYGKHGKEPDHTILLSIIYHLFINIVHYVSMITMANMDKNQQSAKQI